jgi:hypothetical protein
LAEYNKGASAIARNVNYFDYPVARAEIDIDDPSLVAAYRMKPTNGVEGTNVPDLKDGGTDGVNTGATFEYGLMGDSMLFHGDTSGDKVNIGTVSATYTDDFTLAAWIKTDVADAQRIIARRESGQFHYVFGLDNVSQVLQFWDDVVSKLGVTSLDDDEWHFIVASIDGSSSQLYVDGATDGTTWTPTITTATTDTLIGASDFGSEFDGNICDVQIYDEAKDATWVAAEYAKGVAAQTANALCITQGWGDTLIEDGNMEKAGTADWDNFDSASGFLKYTPAIEGQQMLQVYDATGSATFRIRPQVAYFVIGRPYTLKIIMAHFDSGGSPHAELRDTTGTVIFTTSGGVSGQFYSFETEWIATTTNIEMALVSDGVNDSATFDVLEAKSGSYWSDVYVTGE